MPYFAHTVELKTFAPFLPTIHPTFILSALFTTMQCGDQFESMDAAHIAIQRHVLDDGESYKTKKSEKKRFILVCKDNECNFRIRATESSKHKISITVFKPHSCSPTVHYKFKQLQSVKYLIEHHRASIIDNRHITTA